MQARIADFYASHRVRLLYVSFGVTLAMFWAVGVFVLFMLKRVEGLSGDEFWTLVAVVESSILLTWGLGVAAILRGEREVVQWMRDGPAPARAVEMWRLVAQLPRRIVVRLLVSMYVPVNVAALVAIDQIIELSTTETVFLVVGIALAFAYDCTVAYMQNTVLLRPVREEISRYLPSEFDPGHGRGLTRQIHIQLVIVAYLSSVSAAMLALDVGKGSESGNEVYVIGAAITLLFILPFLLLLAEQFLGPVQVLSRATQRVAAGDLTTRVPHVGDAELGGLIVTFNAMLGELEAATDDLRASRSRLVVVADEERRRLERDIHDGAQQRLVLLQLELSQLVRGLAPDDPMAVKLSRLRENVREALEELRDLAHGIYPAVLESDGLPGALEEAAQRAVIPTSVECDGAGRYPSEVEAAVYFCCLEALQNAGKHAGEEAQATISLADRGGALHFTVADDGAGFDMARADGSHGLQNMVDRIGALGGTLEVVSTPGTGTRVVGTVPSREEVTWRA